MTPEPPRLRDTESELGRLLRQAHDDLPTEAEMARIAAHLTPPSLPTSAPSPLGTLPAVGAAGGAIALALFLLLRSPPTPRPTPAPPPPPAPSATSTDEPPPPASVLLPTSSATPRTPPPPRRLPPPEPSSLPAPPPETARAPSSPPEPALDPSLEIRWLEQARSQLSTSPADALATLRAHLQRFPASRLAHEREVLFIEALDRLGQRAEAQTRARRLLEAQPSSPYRDKLQRFLPPP